jgi:Tfp pilus assembly protein PilF
MNRKVSKRLLLMATMLGLTACAKEPIEVVEPDDSVVSYEQAYAKLSPELQTLADETRKARNAAVAAGVSLYISQGQYADAEQLTRSALQVHSTDPVLLRILASIYEAQGDHDQASEYLLLAEQAENSIEYQLLFAKQK